MRILLVVPDFHPRRAGYAHACTAFAQALGANGRYRVDVVTPVTLEGEPELAADGVRIHRVRPANVHIRSLDQAGVGTERELWRKVREVAAVHGPFDWVLFETAEFPLAGNLALRHFGAERVAVRVHAASETEWVLYRREAAYRLKRLSTARFFRKARYILSTTEHYLDFVRREFLHGDPIIAASKRYGVVPNVVLRTRPDNEAGERSPLDVRQLLTLGRMDEHGALQKNFARLLMALARVRQAGPAVSFQLTLVGDGPERKHLMALAQRLAIGDITEFLPALPLSEVHDRQRTASGVVLASTYEGQSMFALESLYHGAPLLVSRGTPLADLVDGEANGALFDPLDVEDIARAVARFLVRSEEELHAARRRSRELFNEQFSTESVVERFHLLLSEFDAERRATAAA